MDAMERDDGGVDRRRLVRRVIAIAAVVQLVVALAFALRTIDEDAPSIRLVTPAGVADEEARTTQAPRVVSEEPSTTTVIAAVVDETTTTALVCRDSFDARCGRFRWDPAPGPNAPLSIEITFSPTNPKAGEPVQFVARIRDPDASKTRTWNGPCTDEKSIPCVSSTHTERCDLFGPWTAPTPEPMDRLEPWTWVFPEPGTFRVWLGGGTEAFGCPSLDPYGSSATGAVEVVVAPNGLPATTTSTTTTSTIAA
jgi:hypothetical protein